MNAESNTNYTSDSAGLIPAFVAVSTNPDSPHTNFPIIDSKQLEEIKKGLAAWKQQEINIKTQEALLAQLKFFYTARRTILFIFPIVVAAVLFVMLYVLYGENILDHKVFKGLTIFIGLAAVFEIVFFPAKEKTLESEIKKLSLETETLNKEINLLKGRVGSLEKDFSSQIEDIKTINAILNQQQSIVNKVSKTPAPKKKKIK